MDTILNELGINDYNFGACSGKDGWSENENNKTLDSFNPSNGNRIASVYMADSNDYERILKDSTKSFNSFRKIPAPVRGDLVRQMGDALRAKKMCLEVWFLLKWVKLSKKEMERFKR